MHKDVAYFSGTFLLKKDICVAWCLLKSIWGCGLDCCFYLYYLWENIEYT